MTMITTYDRRRTIPLVVSTRLDTEGYMTALRYTAHPPPATCDTDTLRRRTLRNGAVRPHPRPPPGDQ